MINYLIRNICKTQSLKIILITILLWFSVGTKIKLNSDIISIDFFNNLRFLIPFIILLFFIYIKKKHKELRYLKIFIFIIFISYLLGYLNFYFLNEELVKIFKNDNYLIHKGYVPNKLRDLLTIFYFIITFFILSKLNENELKLVNITNILLLFLLTLITLFLAYKEFVLSDKAYLYYTTFLVDGEIANVSTIRSLGLGRNLLIIIIPFIIYLFLSNKQIKFRFFIYIILIFLISNLFQLQSRLSIYSFYLFILVILSFLIHRKNYKNILVLISLFLIIPNIASFSVPYIKGFFTDVKIDTRARVYTLNPNNLKIVKDNTFLNKPKIEGMNVINIDEKTDKAYVYSNIYSSGRVDLWNKTLDIFTKSNNYNKKFFGFGPYSDRYFIKESMSNSILYVLLSGGLIGLVGIILLYLITIKRIAYGLFNSNFKNDYISISCIFIIFFLFLRSLVENSFVVFGTDHIIFISCVIYLFIKKPNKQI